MAQQGHRSYKWKNDLLGKENTMTRAEKKNLDLPNDKNQLLSKIETLQEQVRRLKIEKDILEAAAELIKKDPGVDLKDLSNREKTALIGALKNEHSLKALLKGLGLSRSSYYYQLWAQSLEGKYKALKSHILERNFHADTPNEKWLTDITEFHIPAGKAYLSPVVDCFDGMLVSWTVSTRPDAELVNTMLDMATGTLNDGECPIIHSDRGCHYR